MITAERIHQYDLIEADGNRYRILGIREKIITIQTGITSRVFRMFETGAQFDADVLSGRYQIIPNEVIPVIPEMSSICQAAYDLNKKIINEVASMFGHDYYIGLSTRKLKECLVYLRDKYLVSKHKLNRLITRWLQSGCSDYALLDHRAKGIRKANGPYQYNDRPGRKNKNPEETSKAILNDSLRAIFEEIIKRKLSAKLGSFAMCFRDIVNEHFSSSLLFNDEYRIMTEEARDLPTLRQFYYYLSHHSGVTDKDRYTAENSESEYRNNCRELKSDTNFGVHGIGDKTEADILDMNVILRAAGYRIAAGRPHLYLLIDIATRIIPGFYLSYTNNSVTGLQGLLHNLGEDKVELCRTYGIEISPEEWPSLFLPGSIFTDNGADFASNQIMELFERFGIERNLEPPAMGSMKGTVEHLFCQFIETHEDLLEKHGVILKRHDSNHYEEAALEIEDIIKIVILFILCHNKQYMKEYPVTREMLDDNVECSPIGLFRYMQEKYPLRRITDKDQFQIDCMFEGNASVKRGDIVFKGHHYTYDPKDLSFRQDFYETIKTSHLTVRYTRVSADFIMYQHDGNWYRAALSTTRSDEATFAGLTRDQLEEYDDKKLSNDNVGDRKNIKVIGDCRKDMKEVVKEAEKKTKDAAEVIPGNEAQILKTEKENAMGKVLPFLKQNHRPPVIPDRISVTELREMSWDEAMEGMYI